jgi:hypothetical protein
MEIKNITVEERDKFRLEGEISIKRRLLRGTIRLGLTREYLDWLPNPEEVFSRRSNGYLWTDVHISGTIDEPKQDLSQRIIELSKNHRARISICFSVSSEIGSRKHLAAINVAPPLSLGSNVETLIPGFPGFQHANAFVDVR